MTLVRTTSTWQAAQLAAWLTVYSTIRSATEGLMTPRSTSYLTLRTLASCAPLLHALDIWRKYFGIGTESNWFWSPSLCECLQGSRMPCPCDCRNQAGIKAKLHADEYGGYALILHALAVLDDVDVVIDNKTGCTIG
eukprot:387250-Pleurochrysis_carterae.AAC.1